MRRLVVSGSTSSGSSSEGKPSAPKSGTAASSGSRNSPSTSTASGCTGPPTQTESPSSTTGSSCGTAAATSTGEGRLSTSPAAPSSVCSGTSTTARRKFGSSSDGEATSRCPRSESMRSLCLERPRQQDAPVEREDAGDQASDGIRQRDGDVPRRHRPVHLQLQRREGRVGPEEADGCTRLSPERHAESSREDADEHAERERARHVDDEGSPREDVSPCSVDEALE